MPAVCRMRLFLTLGMFCVLGALPVHAGEVDFRKEKKRYEDYLDRPSLRMRTRGREKFARTGDLRALKILTSSYTRTEKPKDANRFLLASLCADHFRTGEAFETFADWRQRNTRARDAWLWYRTLAAELGGDGVTTGRARALEIIRGSKPGILRMAALEAFARTMQADVLEIHSELLAAPAGRPFDDELLLRSAADTLVRKRNHRALPPWRTLAAAVIARLGGDGLSDDARLVVARRLGEVFGTSTLHRRPEPWQALLEGRAPDIAADAASTSLADFLGMKATGSRIGYVIDLSDSMLEPVTVKELKDLAKLATLPWDKITSRFDAARELIRASLDTLDEKKSFFVVTFGSEAKLLSATPGLRPATTSMKKKVMRELDGMEIGPPKTGRPHGTLGGYTNLHGGLHRAFEVRGSGRVKQDEYVDPDLFTKGCDTIFLLSDGKPTWDDYPTVDTLEPEDDPGDPESGYKSTQSRTATFYGPYTLTRFLRDDLSRMNLFRRVEIHCVGLGEYDPHLLDWLARLGHGTLRRIGDGPEKKKKGKAGGK